MLEKEIRALEQQLTMIKGAARQADFYAKEGDLLFDDEADRIAYYKSAENNELGRLRSAAVQLKNIAESITKAAQPRARKVTPTASSLAISRPTYRVLDDAFRRKLEGDISDYRLRNLDRGELVEWMRQRGIPAGIGETHMAVLRELRARRANNAESSIGARSFAAKHGAAPISQLERLGLITMYGRPGEYTVALDGLGRAVLAEERTGKLDIPQFKVGQYVAVPWHHGRRREGKIVEIEKSPYGPRGIRYRIEREGGAPVGVEEYEMAEAFELTPGSSTTVEREVADIERELGLDAGASAPTDGADKALKEIDELLYPPNNEDAPYGPEIAYEVAQILNRADLAGARPEYVALINNIATHIDEQSKYDVGDYIADELTAWQDLRGTEYAPTPTPRAEFEPLTQARARPSGYAYIIRPGQEPQRALMGDINKTKSRITLTILGGGGEHRYSWRKKKGTYWKVGAQPKKGEYVAVKVAP